MARPGYRRFNVEKLELLDSLSGITNCEWIIYIVVLSDRRNVLVMVHKAHGHRPIISHDNCVSFI